MSKFYINIGRALIYLNHNLNTLHEFHKLYFVFVFSLPVTSTGNRGVHNDKKFCRFKETLYTISLCTFLDNRALVYI